jgi:hypothetical protein
MSFIPGDEYDFGMYFAQSEPEVTCERCRIAVPLDGDYCGKCAAIIEREELAEMNAALDAHLEPVIEPLQGPTMAEARRAVDKL